IRRAQQHVERPRRRLARPRRGRQGARGPLRRADRRWAAEGHRVGRRRAGARPGARPREGGRTGVTGVVVTGRGVVSSIGEGADAFFEALLAKRSGIEDGAGACTGFDPETAMTGKEARRADRFTQLAVNAAEQAVAEAAFGGIEAERLGVIGGTGVGGLMTLEAECKAWLEGGDRAVSPLFVPMMMPNAAAGTI